MPTKTKLPKVTEYVKNVGKSAAFFAIDALKESEAKGILEFLEVNDDIFKEGYASLKDFKGTFRKTEKSIKQNNIYKAITYGLKNMAEDIKSGKLYNNSRSDEAIEEAYGMGLSDDDIDLYSRSSYDNEYSYSKDTEKLADSFDEAIGAAATTQATAVAQGTQTVVNTSIANTSLIMSKMDIMTAKLSSSVGALYSSTSGINKFLNGPLTAHMENSRIYYENSLKTMNEQKAMIKELLEMERNLYKKESMYNSSTNNPYDDIFRGNGILDIKSYTKHVMKNTKNYLDMMGFGMLDAGGDGNMLKTLMANPFSLIIGMSGLGGKIIPKKIKENLKNFTNSFTGFFPQLFARLNNQSARDGSGEGLLSFISDIFGIKLQKKTRINTGNFEKGPVPFDGITRQTIIEVIPGYLARIESALTGLEERHYDKNTGSWKNISVLEDEFKSVKARAIASGNADLKHDLAKFVRSISSDKRYHANADKAINNMITRIYEEGGDFDPYAGMRANDSRSKAYIHYFNDMASMEGAEDLFNAFLYRMGISDYIDSKGKVHKANKKNRKILNDIARNNMEARQSHNRMIESIERDAGPVRNLFNGAYDPTGRGWNIYRDSKNFSKAKGTGLLAASRDSQGRNVFWYLREILKNISARHNIKTTNARNKRKATSAYSHSYDFNDDGDEEGSSSGSSDSSDDDPSQKYYGSDIDSQLAFLDDEREKEEKEKAKKNKLKNKLNNFTDWIRKRGKNSPIAKFFANAMDGAGSLLSKPLQYANDLLEKASDSMFSLIFGDELRDKNGNRVTLLKYLANKIEDTFKEVMTNLTDFLKNKVFNKIKNFIYPIWNKYGKPIWDNVKDTAKAGADRVRGAFSRTFGGIWNRMRKGETVPTDEVVDNINNGGNFTDYESDGSGMWDIFDNDIFTDFNINNSARGRFVTKRGLTMISPGEIIIPATFDKKKQNKMLQEEKKDRYRIYNALGRRKGIGLNARGTEGFKEDFDDFYNKHKNTIKNTATGGVLGAGAGLFTGNPIFGALIGSAIGLLKDNERFKSFMFGDETFDKEGNYTGRSGGVVPKSIINKVKKYAPDAIDFGIVGAGLGLFSPFGILGGATLGAGIGLLKNNESFKKFLLGDAETDDDSGLISKGTQKKIKDVFKKSGPAMGIGAVAGIFTGPFGLLGNAALGAGIGLLTTTEEFKKFMFGDGDPDNPNKGGLVGSIKRGILEPIKDTIHDLGEHFKGYLKKNILDPLKDFMKPVTQAIKNTITSVGDKIADKMNDMFEKTLGIPLADFLQQKIFKPVTRFVTGILKAPIKLLGAAVSLPFKALGGIGNSIRMRQIQKGTAYDMSAKERMEFREKHSARAFFGRLTGKDIMEDQDALLATLSAEDLDSLGAGLKENLEGSAKISRRAGDARKDLGGQISGFFNAKMKSGKSGYDLAGYKKVKKIAKIAASGDIDRATNLINGLKGFTEGEKSSLIKQITEATIKSGDAMLDLKTIKTGNKALDKELAEKFGHKFKSRSGRRQLMKAAEAEARFRKAEDEKREAGMSPEEKASKTLNDNVVNFKESILKKIDRLNGGIASILGIKTTDEENEALGIAVKSNSNGSNTTSLISKAYDTETGMWITSNDPKSKENKQNERIRKENEKEEDEAEEATKQSAGHFDELMDKLFGDKKRKRKTGGLLSKLGSGFDKVMNWLGIGGKAIKIGGAVLVGGSLLGYASEWMKTSVLPGAKKLLFGEKSEDGSIKSHGILGGLKNVLLGDDGKSGVLGTFFGWISEKVGSVINWFKDGGLQKLLGDMAAKLVTGWGYTMDNIISPLIALVIKNLPQIIYHTGKGILKALFVDLWNKDLGSSYSSSVDISSMVKEIQSVNNTSSVLDSTGDPEFASTIKSNFNNKNNISGSILSFNSSGVARKSSDSEVNNKKKSLINTWTPGQEIIDIGGLLGETRRTNEIEYDENGNIITTYTRKNSTDSILSKAADVANTAFWRGVAGNGKQARRLFGAFSKLKGKGIGKRLTKAVTKTGSLLGKGFGNIGTLSYDLGSGDLLKRIMSDGTENVASNFYKDASGRWYDAITGKFVKSGIAEGAMNTSKSGGIFSRIGKSIKDKFMSTKVGEKLTTGVDNIKNLFTSKSAKDAVGDVIKNSTNDALEGAAKKGILNSIEAGLKNAFKFIAKSKIGQKIISMASKAKKLITGELLEKALMECAEKMCKKGITKLAGKGLKKVLSAVGGKIPYLSIAFWVADFVSGMDQAYTILGVAHGDYEVKWYHRIICGLVNLLTNQFTFGLIPADTILDVFIDVLFPLFGVNTKELNAARDQAEAILDDWNREHPEETYDNLEDFNNKDKWYTKVGNSVKDFFGNVGSSIKNAFTGKKNKDASNSVGYLDHLNNLNKTKYPQLIGYANNGNGTGIGTNARGGLVTETMLTMVSPGEYIIPASSNKGVQATQLATERRERNKILKAIKGNSGETSKNSSDLMNLFKNINKYNEELWSLAKEGNEDFFKVEYESDQNASTSSNILGRGIFGILKMMNIIPAGITYFTKKVVDVFGDAFNKYNDALNIKKQDDQKIQKAKDGDLSIFNKEYWSSGNYKDDFFGIFSNLQAYSEKILNAPVILIHAIGNKISSAFSGVHEWFGEKFGGLWEWIKGFFGGDDAEKVQNELYGSSASPRSKERNISGKGHTYQSSPGISNIRYGNSTIGKSGCAPVAATNLLNRISNGSMDVRTAAKFAENNNLIIPGGGTNIKYFNSFLNSQGISTINTSNKEKILEAIKNGNQVVMLGKDGSNGANAPFGTTPHFITAVGMDKSGNIIVEDPDLGSETVKYNKNKLLKSMITSVVTRVGGKGKNTDTTTNVNTDTGEESETLFTKISNLGKKIMRIIYGDAYERVFGDPGSIDINNENKGLIGFTNYLSDTTSNRNYSTIREENYNDMTKYIWDYLKYKGYSDSGVAGMMGNFMVESGMNPNNMENSYEKKIGHTDQSYTQAVDYGTYSRQKFGEDAVGYGLPQYTYKTWKYGLYDHAKDAGLSIGSPKAQLDYMDHIFQNDWNLSKTRKIREKLFDTNATPEEQAMTMLYNFEMPDADKKSDMPYIFQKERKANAREIYNKYAGSESTLAGSGRTGIAANAIARKPAYYGNSRTTSSTPSVDYATFLQTIVTVLMSIADNTAILGKILEILSSNFDIKIDKSDIESAAKLSRAEAQKHLDDLVRRSTNNTVNTSKLLNNKGTEYILAAMEAIAKE